MIDKHFLPTISIITVVYNDKIGLASTLDSIFGQVYKDFELIIIDGSSTDGTLDTILHYSEHIDYYISEADNGIYDAMNKGISKASGKYIYFLNSGDLVYPDTFLKIDKMLTSQNNHDVIYGEMDIKNSNKKMTAYTPDYINYDMPFCHQAVLVKTELYKQTKFNLRYKIAADYDFFLKLYYQGYIFNNSNICFGIYDTTGVSNRRYFTVLAEYIKILWINNSGLSKILNVWNYLWAKKLVTIYIISRHILGESTYRKLRGYFDVI